VCLNWINAEPHCSVNLAGAWEAYRTSPQLPRSEKQETRQSPRIRFKLDLKNRLSDVFMTPEVTFLRRGAQNIAASQKNRG
jgi:hypothetical protein